jgi:NAD+ kinase
VRIALLAKPESETAAAVAAGVYAWLRDRGHTVLLDSGTAALTGLPAAFERTGFHEDVELAVVLGGDGTQLLAARIFSPGGVPVFGVNLGRLGFLTDVDPDQMIPALERVLAGDFTVQERMMLRGDVLRDGASVHRAHAFNDIVVGKGQLAQVIRIETRVNGQFVSRYVADGLIVATPTGSPAYGLAVGGPIIEPSTDVLLVAPISPHMLTNRPLVLSGASVVECLILEARGTCYLTIDGQEGFPLVAGDIVRVVQSEHRARLVRAASGDFFEILRDKMGWGSA